MRVLAVPDYPTLSQTAAELVARAVGRKPDLCLGLPTGSTPLGMYKELVRMSTDGGVRFLRVRTFNLDEYLGLPRNHPKSSHTYMQQHLLRHIEINPANVHIPDGSPGVDTETESTRFEDAIRHAGGLDLVIVGIGANGHIAFNEPGSPFDSRTRAVDLAAETIANARRHFGSEPVPRRAITMGIGTILEARRILLLACGPAKADAIHRALHGPVTESVPASALRLHQHVLVILDEAALCGKM
jgi:glucosamine-6-phosphate deaminase